MSLDTHQPSSPGSTKSTNSSASEPIYQVDEVTYAVIKTMPPKLQIMAVGLARSGGYTNAQLSQHEYVQFPPDGIWDFTFVADAPTGTVTLALEEITVEPFVWPDYPVQLKGVRVHAATNSVEKLFDSK